MLNEERREQIRRTLTANVNTRAGQAWREVDLDEATDDQLLAFNEFYETLHPVERGVACSCGRKHTYNWDRAVWNESGTPKLQKQPGSVAEFLANGGGTQADRDTWEAANQIGKEKRTNILERLTANMSDDQKRSAFWHKHAETPLPELEEMLDLLGSQDPASRGPNYFGQQGVTPPTANTLQTPSSVIPVLDSPVLEFQKPTRRTG